LEESPEIGGLQICVDGFGLSRFATCLEQSKQRNQRGHQQADAEIG
jgi:hypothetical protein